MSFRYPVGHPKAGQPVIDCAWIDAAGNHIDANGSFVELNNEGEPRRMYGIIPSFNKQMNKITLKDIARKLNVPFTEDDTKATLCTNIRDATKALKLEATVLADMSRFNLPD